MFNLLGKTVSTWNTIVIIIVVWIIATVIIRLLSPSIEDVSTNESSEFLPSGTEAFMAVEIAEEKFSSIDGLPAVILLRNPNGLTEEDIAHAAAIDAKLRSSEAPDNIAVVISDFAIPADLDADSAQPSQDIGTPVQSGDRLPSMSTDGTALTMTVIISGFPFEDEFRNTVEWIRELDAEVGTAESTAVAVTGPAGIFSDASKVFESFDFRVTLITVGLVLTLMVLIYRSPMLALLPIFAVALALTIAQSLAALLADNFDLALNGQVTAIMSVLMFGIGTDFTLFIVSRYKEEILRCENRFDAIAVTMKAVGPSIAGSGGTTIIAMLALMLALSGELRAMGPMLAMSVFVMLLAAMTLIPALLASLGRVAFWPLDPYKPPAANRGIWHRIGTLVAERPGLLFATTAVLLLVFSAGLFTLNPRYSFFEGFPEDLESRAGFISLVEAYPAGELAPTYAYISKEGDSIMNHLGAIDDAAATLLKDPGVVKVSGLTRPFGEEAPPIPIAMLQETVASLPQNIDPANIADLPPESAEAAQFFIAGSRFLSDDGTTTRLDIVLADDPYDTTAMDTVPRLRESFKSSIASSSLAGADALVGGETATNEDYRTTVRRDMIVVSPIVVIAIWIILALILRSVVAPTYLVLSVALSIATALGLSVLVFQNILGHEGMGFGNIPFVFVFLIALGADYNIYIMSRVREETRLRGLVEGTRYAITRTGGVITSAGIILAGTFAVLMTFPLRDLFQVGFTVMLGILIDTFIIRALLVPAIVVKLGELNWWPSKSLPRSALPTQSSNPN